MRCCCLQLPGIIDVHADISGSKPGAKLHFLVLLGITDDHSGQLTRSSRAGTVKPHQIAASISSLILQDSLQLSEQIHLSSGIRWDRRQDGIPELNHKTEQPLLGCAAGKLREQHLTPTMLASWSVVEVVSLF